MKLPLKVKVSYLDYNIQELPFELAVAGDKHGDCDHIANLIRVQLKGHSQQQQANTLFHEIIHAVFHLYGVSLKTEEMVVCGLSNGFCQVIRDNPKVMKFICGGLNATH